MKSGLRRGNSERSGYLLAAALGAIVFAGLFSFFVLQYLRQEQAAESAASKADLAREYARYALAEAYASLQHYAGPDQVATRRSEGTAAIWTDGQEVVLLSSSSEDESEAIHLGREGESAVVAPRYRIDPPTIAGVRTWPGAAAWWIDDEGVKAPLAPEVPGEAVLLEPDRTPADQNRLARLIASRVRTDEVLPEFDPSEPQLQTAVTPWQVEQVSGLDSFSPDFTPRNAFVLADSGSGGLRQDLSHLYRDHGEDDFLAPGVLSDAFAGARAQQFLGPREAGSGPLAAQVADGFPFHPVVSEALLACGVAGSWEIRREGSRVLREVCFYYVLFADIWNPWGRAMGFPAEAADVRVTFRGLPPVTIPGEGTFALPDPLVIDTQIFENELRPGELRHIVEPRRGGGTDGNGVWRVPLGTVENAARLDAFDLAVGSSEVVVEFSLLSEGQADPFFTVSLPAAEAFEVGFSADPRFVRDYGWKDPYNREVMSRGSLGEIGFAWHFRMRESNGLPTLWLPGGERDPREAAWQMGLDDPYYTRAFAPPDYVKAQTFPATDFFARNYAMTEDALEGRLAAIFDVPGQESVSVGDLQHLFLPNTPAQSLGAPGSSLNDAYDRFFFSGLPREVTPWLEDPSRPLANPRIAPWFPEGESAEVTEAHLTSPASAHRLLLRNGFNINSRSVEAWTAVLSGLEAPAHAFYARPHSAGAPLFEPLDAYQLDLDAYPLANDQEHPALTQAGRRLSSAQVEALAAAVVAELHEQAAPFSSLRKFLDSEVLRDAIARVPELNFDGALPQGAPTAITQELLAAYLAPFAFARSDTFRIRTAGQVLNPSTGEVEAVAWCEAWAQRTPEPVDVDRPEEGRHFRLVDFRWLSADDL